MTIFSKRFAQESLCKQVHQIQHLKPPNRNQNEPTATSSHSSSNISKLPPGGAPRCTAPPFVLAKELVIVSLPLDWVKLFFTEMAPAAEQMLWFSAKELGGILAFTVSR